MLRRLLLRKPQRQPVGRWIIGGDWERRAQLASEDSCYCVTHLIIDQRAQIPYHLTESKEQQ